MHRAPINSNGPVKGKYPQILPQTVGFVDQVAMFAQHKGLSVQTGAGVATREVTVARVVKVALTVLMSGEVITSVVVGAGATLICVVVKASVAV